MTNLIKAIGIALILTWIVARAFPAAADQYQQWIHDNANSCCDHRDCRPATVNYTLYGWEVQGALWPVPWRDVIRWPFGVPYACWSGNRVRCLLLREGM